MELEEIRPDLDKISLDLDEISSDLDRSEKIIQTNYFNQQKKLFPMCFLVKSVEIDFPCSNPSTNPPVLDFGIRDLPPTVTGVGSVDS